MNLDGKKILIFAVLIFFVVVGVWPDSPPLKISGVEDGNTIVLSNGTTVKLLGISSSYESQEELQTYKGELVTLVPERGTVFVTDNLDKSSTVYAYVALPERNDRCINSMLLKSGKALYLDNCVDSMTVYQRYARINEENETVEPTPTPKQEIDYNEDDIVLPEYPLSPDRKHSVWYVDGSKNIEMLEEACDYDRPYTKRFANQLAARSQGPFNPGQICEVYAYCCSKWSYVNDPKGSEYLASASETISSSLTGDCDDYAILMASCMLAIGADVCVSTGHSANGSGHAFTEVDISQFDSNDVLDAIKARWSWIDVNQLHIRQADGKVWLNLDWQKQYPGGPYFDCSNGWDAYICEDGQWRWKHIR